MSSFNFGFFSLPNEALNIKILPPEIQELEFTPTPTDHSRVDEII